MKPNFYQMLNESFKDGKSTVELMEECYEIGKKESGQMDRDCNNCIYHTEKGCTKWDCNGTVKYDAETQKWFNGHFERESTVCRCDKCGLYYKPSLGHECRKESDGE